MRKYKYYTMANQNLQLYKLAGIEIYLKLKEHTKRFIIHIFFGEGGGEEEEEESSGLEQ